MSPSQCTSLPPLSPSLASTRLRQLQVALESLRPANDDAGGREDWRAGEEINSCGSGPVQGEGLMCMARRAEAVRSRTIHSARPAGVSRVNPKRGSTADSTVAIIETAFHYVNCHPRGDPVSSLSNDLFIAVTQTEKQFFLAETHMYKTQTQRTHAATTDELRTVERARAPK